MKTKLQKNKRRKSHCYTGVSKPGRGGGAGLPLFHKILCFTFVTCAYPYDCSFEEISGLPGVEAVQK